MIGRVLGACAVACVAIPVLAQEPMRVEAAPIVWIAGGAFAMGASEGDLAYASTLCDADLEVDAPGSDGCHGDRFLLTELPRSRVVLGTFGIDRLEVTNAAYRRCVLAGVCAPSAERESTVLGAADHPVVGVSQSEASTYCEWANGRLPNEREWEKAARGDDETRRFPWGATYDSRASNHGRSPMRTDSLDGFVLTSPVGAFPDGASVYGVLDLAGNVAEWTADVPTLRVDLGVDLSAYRVVRGGSYTQAITSLRVTARSWATIDARASDVGFRCAYDPR
jgi:formylglycine-generating enzyme required for sulfatase activity